MSKNAACINMIKQQLRTNDVLNEAILDLYERLPRHEFVPAHFTEFAYSDMQIPLPHGQRMLTPLEEGLIVQALNLKGSETVLEVGTGSGFLTAMLSKLCKKVISVDYYADFTVSALAKLQAHQCTNVELITGDACYGWVGQAPYDVVVFTGALEQLGDTQKLQVIPGGTLFAIEGSHPIMAANIHRLDHQEQWHSTLLFETDIPPLIDCFKQEQFVF